MTLPLHILRAQADAKAANLEAARAPYPRTLVEHVTPAASATAPGAFVVRDFGPDHHDDNRYVAHWRNDENPARPYYVWGRYHEDLDDALRSHLERVVREAARA